MWLEFVTEEHMSVDNDVCISWTVKGQPYSVVRRRCGCVSFWAGSYVCGRECLRAEQNQCWQHVAANALGIELFDTSFKPLDTCLNHWLEQWELQQRSI